MMNDPTLKIVVKVEISTLVNPDGTINPNKVERLVLVLSNLHNSGKQLLIVSSGAIVLGSAKMGLCNEPDKLIKKQATAAVGQAELIRMYQHYFEDYNQVVAQILITSDVVNVPKRRENAKNTMLTLLDMNIIPIINENDTISTDDIELDDNYPLVLNVANMLDAELILVKSHVEGNYLLIPRGDLNLITDTTETGLFTKIQNYKELNIPQGIGESFPETFKMLNYY